MDLTGPRQFFKRAPLRTEWFRFKQQYASKVQHLEVSSPDAVISPAALHLLQLYSPYSPLLPNLVSLSWDSDESFLPFILPFISRSLTSIVIDVPRGASPMLPPILTTLSALSPDIREIQIERLYHSSSTEEASSHLLMLCNPYRLRKYNVDSPISAPALRHVIQLPSLEEFWLVVDSFQLPDPLPVVVFPSLRLLDVEYRGDHTWLKLLSAFENPVLTSIFVECSGSDVAQFMEAFQLTLARCGMNERLQEFRVRSQDEFKITPQIIACTFPFKNLTSLKVLSECSPTVCQTFDLTDDNIDLLTKAMPRLESLAIGEEPCGVPSQITFKSLYIISRRCPRLTTLQIHFNPALFVTKVDTDSESGDVALGLPDLKSPPSDLCSVTTIDVGNIPLPTESNTSYIMALGLLGVFPRLEKLEYGEGDWEDIDDLIGVCRRMGRFAFGKD
ncbi:hypothetical protein BDM02DRAFT_3270902 [Thelephora ganbajun]|uniref:Uncharacterized protein n=1 Tax=Thelephora ganbajun TaxID=370292 RepID=A0ACB6Z9X5_THEGA|nr:hypothetical protein BDM02DRAFT_3270902 [Thelephora ganbajun]